MKKMFLICALLLSATMAKAQELRWGITGGVNLSSPTNYDSQVGYNVGVKGEYLFKEDKGFYLDWGVSLSQKGWKATGTMTSRQKYLRSGRPTRII